MPTWLPPPRRTTPCAVSSASRARSENLFTSIGRRLLVFGGAAQRRRRRRGQRARAPPCAPAPARSAARARPRATARRISSHRLGEPRVKAVDLARHRRQPLLHGEHALDSGQVEADVGELLDAPQPLDVAARVAPRVLGRALRPHQAAPLVDAQGLRVHAGQLGGDRDHEQRSVDFVLEAHRSSLASRPSASTRARGPIASHAAPEGRARAGRRASRRASRAGASAPC